MNRREFGKIAAAAAPAMARALQPGPDANVTLAGLNKGASDTQIENAVMRAVEAATDMSWLSKGDTVFIKPVLNSGNPYPATTHPASLKTMVRILKEKGAKRVIVSDMSGIEHVKLEKDAMHGSSRELMRSAGLFQAAEAAGAEVYFPEEDGWDAFYEEGPTKGSSWKAGLMMPKILKQADHIVLMPRCSRHVLAGSTLGLKAAVGYWRTDTRLEYHRDAATLQEKTAEANTVPVLLEKQRLVISTATKVLTTFGPDMGYVHEPETGLIIASDSVVAHDMVSLAWLIENRKAIPQSEIGIVSDPYTSQFAVHNGNRLVVYWLGGVGEAAKAQTLKRFDLNEVWDDRVLNQAYRTMGGTPRVNLVGADENVPSKLRKKIKDLVTLPA
jgi:uncharacterized protein (DUF362 family)